MGIIIFPIDCSPYHTFMDENGQRAYWTSQLPHWVDRPLRFRCGSEVDPGANLCFRPPQAATQTRLMHAAPLWGLVQLRSSFPHFGQFFVAGDVGVRG
jgi:hypothetical protein